MWAGQTRSHAHGEPAPFVPVGAPGDWSRWLSAGGGKREQCGGVGGQCGGAGGQRVARARIPVARGRNPVAMLAL